MTRLPSFVSRGRVVDAVLVVLCGIAQAAAIAVTAFATRAAFSEMHSGTAPDIWVLTALVGAGILSALFVFVSRCRSEALGQSYANALRHALYTHLAGLPKSRHSERRVGALALRFVGDLSAAQLWIGRGLPGVLSALVVLPGAIVILWALDDRLAVAAMVPIFGAICLMMGIAAHLEQRHRSLRTERANLSIAMLERIAIMPELDLLGRTPRELRMLDERGQALRRNAIARTSRFSALQAILQAGVAIAGGAVLWTAGTAEIATGTTAAALAVLALLALPLREIAKAWNQYCAWRVAREKAFRLFGEPSQRRTPHRCGPVALEVSGQIDRVPVSIALDAGKTAILSGSHAGKLATVIAGLNSVPGLSVRYDGTDRLPVVAYIGDMHIGLQGSLRRTLTLSCVRRPKDNRIKEVLRAFGLGELERRLGGLDGRIAEGGRNLSAAETLRIDLARAVLGKAGLVVIHSLRFANDPDASALKSLVDEHLAATFICVMTPNSWEAPGYTLDMTEQLELQT